MFASFKEFLALKAAEVSAVSVFVELKTGLEAEVSAFSVFAGLTAGLDAAVSVTNVAVCVKPRGGLGGTSVLLLGSWVMQLPILIYLLLEFVFVFF